MAIKLILREAVDHLGERGDIVTVAPGYARNFLLPKGLALEATPGNLKTIQHQRRVWAVREQQELKAAQELAGQMSAIELSVTKKAGESGTLYGSVTKAEILELLARKGFEVDRRRIGPDEPIKNVGQHELSIKLHREVTALIKLNVVAEDEGAEAD